jgi:acetyl esterase/lipase
LQRAIDLVRTRAGEWNINPAKIGVMGFSAGGHLAATGGTHFNRRHVAVQSGDPRPDFLILAYSVVTSDPTFTHSGSIGMLLGRSPSPELLEEFSAEKQVTNNTPPSFLVHSADDSGVPVRNSLVFAEALAKHNIPFEMHVFPKGGHGYGTNNKTAKTDWFALCIEWIKGL